MIGPSSPLGYPAPYWLLVFFKVLGFTLHMVPMNLWYAGIIVAMLLSWQGGEYAKYSSARLMKQMPVIIAAGVNFGIIPLLFTQVAYYKVFYPATILMAWPWLAIFILLTLAYYGVYIYVIGLRHNGERMGTFRKAAGWASALIFLVIGFLFSNAFSLMTNVAAWPDLWQKTSIAGAPLGIALNTSDATFWPRWLLMFGLALMTTAVYFTIDANFFAANSKKEHREWVSGFALKLYTLGIIWFGITSSWYVLGTWPEEQRQIMFSGSLLILTILTAISPALTWFFLVALRHKKTRSMALLAGLAQFVVITLNAVSRQIVQNIELSKFLDVTGEKVKIQWSPLILFLILLVIGVGIVLWMIRKVIQSHRVPVAGRG